MEVTFLTNEDGDKFQEQLDTKSSIYIGSGDPPDDCDIHIDPDGDGLNAKKVPITDEEEHFNGENVEEVLHELWEEAHKIGDIQKTLSLIVGGI